MQHTKPASSPPRHQTMPELAWLTREQLYLAYRDLYTPLWPATVEEALRDDGRCIAIVRVAARRARVSSCVAHTPHRLPRLPAPPTPQQHELVGRNAHGRSAYSLAKGPPTELGSWPAPLPMPTPRRRNTRPAFDPKKAAANDLDD